ncbi:hypothetical protein DLE01_04810 [Streptomyces sp. FT05W]|nr:hypothetical protein DLE01_04810 [Streptomyces sp. FT05W]
MARGFSAFQAAIGVRSDPCPELPAAGTSADFGYAGEWHSNSLLDTCNSPLGTGDRQRVTLVLSTPSFGVCFISLPQGNRPQ